MQRFELTLDRDDLLTLQSQLPSLAKVELLEDEQKGFCAQVLNNNGDVLISSSWAQAPILAYDEIGMIEMPIKATETT